jgi:branched-chain amino acid transport system ATP-binding protein
MAPAAAHDRKPMTTLVAPQAAFAELIVEGVSKRFGGLVAVNELSLSVPVGRVHGLIGPNGAGKSTAIALIAGYLRPNTGRVVFGPHDLTRTSPSRISRLGIARTFQQATPLGGLTVYENILVGLHCRYDAGLAGVLFRSPAMRREAKELVRVAQDLLALFGLEAYADADARNLTFGQLRFLEIARAIAMGPRILLLDEPAAGLNDVERDKLATLVRRFRNDGVGVLLVDHDVPFVFGLCDRMTVMNFGSVIASGVPDEVHRDPAVREAYLGDAPVKEHAQ